MGFDKFVKRTVRKYGDDITGMVGGNLTGLTWSLSDKGTGAAGTNLNVNKSWWRGASRADRRGMLLHELTHVATRDQGLGTGPKAEKIAEAVRFSLNGNVGINPDYAPGYKAYARNQGWFGGGNDMAGPGSNDTGTNRNRDTLRNNWSKRAPVLGPAYQAGITQQLQGLQTQYSGALALYKAAQAGARANSVLARGEARTNALAGMNAVNRDALGRGMVGSSAQLQGQADVIAQRTADRNAAFAERDAALAEASGNKIAALGQYYLGVGQVASDAAATQAEMAIQQYEANLLARQGQQSYADIRRRIRQNYRARYGDIPNSPNTPGKLYDNSLMQGTGTDVRYAPPYRDPRLQQYT